MINVGRLRFIVSYMFIKHLYVSPTNENTEWSTDYMFDYNNVDKERLMKLIE